MGAGVISKSSLRKLSLFGSFHVVHFAKNWSATRFNKFSF